MCMIVDVNVFGEIFAKENGASILNEVSKPVIDWLLSDKRGRIVHADIGPGTDIGPGIEVSYQERVYLRGIKKAIIDWLPPELRELLRTDAIFELNHEVVLSKMIEIKNSDSPKSNDIHILAMAILGNATVLATNDRRLKHDFRNIIGGEIYSGVGDEGLLTKDACPRS